MIIDVVIDAPVVEIDANPQTAVIELETPVLVDHVDTDPYTGPYTVTPTRSTQILNTNNLRMTDNVTVNPIPQNYGLITWDGSVLTVS